METYISNNNPIELWKLKRLDTIDENISLTTNDMKNIDGALINEFMERRFGNGCTYRFKRIQVYTGALYTHVSNDGYFYRDTWVEEDTFKDKDFEL